MISTGISETGLVRKNNEDTFLVDNKRGLFIVCDGMGGHNGGEIASNMAVNTVAAETHYTNSDEALLSLKAAIEKANYEIWVKGRENPELLNMGTTIIAAAIVDNRLTACNVGDSCLYLIRSQDIIKITRDHTLAESMIEDGLLNPGEIRNNSYKHILTRAIGSEETVIIDFFTYDLEPGDRILLCSDGLTDLLLEHDIWKAVALEEDIKQAAQNLIDIALHRGGHDNITTVLISI